jgi:RNA polymerase sigma-70 factor (ECF subfamily)
MRLILGELRSLAEPEREVLALCDWACLGYAEAAVALGVPVGTVRSRLARARQRLRERAAHAGPIATLSTTNPGDQP